MGKPAGCEDFRDAAMACEWTSPSAIQVPDYVVRDVHLGFDELGAKMTYLGTRVGDDTGVEVVVRWLYCDP
ncbi:MAG: hypothetical protein H6732_20445 [Alphaproteobacteria bacterium]|nr:hypothetical protein [Alphaproteobacteria bacterium]